MVWLGFGGKIQTQRSSSLIGQLVIGGLENSIMQCYCYCLWAVTHGFYCIMVSGGSYGLQKASGILMHCDLLAIVMHIEYYKL